MRARLLDGNRKASEAAAVNWLIAAFDGESLHLVPEPEG
jgi:hypothetical protein